MRVKQRSLRESETEVVSEELTIDELGRSDLLYCVGKYQGRCQMRQTYGMS